MNIRTPPPRHTWLWIVILLGLKFAGSKWESYKDTWAIARQMVEAGVTLTTPVFVVDEKINGLRLYGYTDPSNTRLWAADYPFFVRWPLAEEAMEARGGIDRIAPLGSRTSIGYLKAELAGSDYECSDFAVDVLRCVVVDCRLTP